MTDLEILGLAPSTYVRSVRLTCIEKGVDHRLVPLDFKSPAHLALHPFGKMPVVKHGDVVVFETAAILDYLDTHFEGPALMPSNRLDRVRARQWMSAAADALYPRAVGAFAGGPPDDVAAAVASLRTALVAFDGALKNTPFIGGDRLGLADLYVWPMVAFAANDDAARSALDGLSTLGEWHTALAERPRFAETAS